MTAKTAARSRTARAEQGMTPGQMAFSRKYRYDPVPGTQRTPAAALPPLTTAERVHERLEDRRQETGWRANRLVPSYRGV